jgi:ubiquinone biosynthesis protein UbiJ
MVDEPCPICGMTSGEHAYALCRMEADKTKRLRDDVEALRKRLGEIDAAK